MSLTLWLWVGFATVVAVLLALDLGVFHRTARVVRIPEALAWSSLWIALALAFNVAVYYVYELSWTGVGIRSVHDLDGRRAALQFFTAFLVEKSLSVDNIFVIALIFSYFRVPLRYQHRVLYWGVLGALVLRGIMIAAGASLLARFDWMSYVFGAILLLTAVRLLVDPHEGVALERNPLVRLFRRLVPLTREFAGDRFFVRVGRRWVATPLLLVLVIVEGSDVVFAIDSIPAVFAITYDPLLVFTSNVFAVLGLRSLYFALAPSIARFRYLKASLVFLLAFVGVKMLLVHHHPIPTLFSLAVIATILLIGISASVLAGGREPTRLISPVSNGTREEAGPALRGARRIVILVIGTSALIVGAGVVLLPRPVMLVPIGLAILAIELVWAHRLLGRLKEVARSLESALEPPQRRG